MQTRRKTESLNKHVDQWQEAQKYSNKHSNILSEWKCSVVSDSLRPHRLYCPWSSPGQNTGVGSLSLLQGIFLTLGSNPGLPYCRQVLYQLSHKGSPRILEWVAYPFSSRSSQPRNQTGVSCIVGRFFINWAMREAQVRWRTMRETWVWSLGWEDPLEKGKAAHSSILAWRILWTL